MNQYSRGYNPQAQNRTPASTRRPGQNLPPSAAQQAEAQKQVQIQAAQSAHRQALLEHQAARRRAEKPTDKNLPDGIEDLIGEELVQQYREMREAEKRLDFMMMRKRLDLQETYSRHHKRRRTMRISISNTAEGQPWQRETVENDVFDFESLNNSTVNIRIEAQMLPEDNLPVEDDEDEMEEQATPGPPDKKMTHYFNRITVEFDKSKNNIPDPNWKVDWKRQENEAETNEFEFTRRLDENINISILLHHDQPQGRERWQLSKVLADTIDLEEADKAEVIMALWEYIKCFNLQQEDDRRVIHCDEQLRKIFNRETLFFPALPDLLQHHLHPLPPVKLPYTVRCDQEYLSLPQSSPTRSTVYSITILADSPLRSRALSLLSSPTQQSQLRDIGRLDDELAVVIQALNHSKTRHTFFKSMARDPISFMNRWSSSQRRDLEVILGEAGRGGGEDGSGPEFARGGTDGVWGSEQVQEAVRYMLAKPPAPVAVQR